MADRYLRASGNWNGPVWAATSGGAAGSASTPTANDDVYLAANFTVTLNIDAIVYRLIFTHGRINLSSYRLTTNNLCRIGFGYFGDWTTPHYAVTLDMGGGSLVTFGDAPKISNNATIISGTSTLEVNSHDSPSFWTASKQFNDVNFNMNSYGGSSTLNITGSPIFRSLIIQSKNSAAHRVNLDNGATITVDKFIAIGSNYDNPLQINNITDTLTTSIAAARSNSTCYGQNILMWDVHGSAWGSAGFIGSNSSVLDSTGWLTQDPPKISTLVDEFNSLSSARWDTQATGIGSYVNASGGNLNMGWAGGSAYVRITTKDTYDLVNETLYLKTVSSTGGLFMSILPVMQQGVTSTSIRTEIEASGERYWRIASTVSGDNATLTMSWFDNGNWVNVLSQTVPALQLRSVRFQIDGTRNMDPASLVVDSVGVGPFPTQPEASFTATPTSGKRPVTVTFTDTTKGIPDTWSWNFGDGATSSSQNPSHTYQRAGTFNVTLTASNDVGSDTVTRSGLITIEPEIFSRSTAGIIKFGGQALRKYLATRSAGGSLLFGGTTRAIVLRDAEAIQDKIYLYKVYNPDGTYVETWKDVISELNFAHEINTIGSTTTVELARNSDTLGVTTAPLQTEDGQNILTEDDQTILVATESRNQIGSGSSVDYNNRVDIIAYYGSVEPLYTESMEEILTEDGEPILAELGAPNGRRVFTGFISEINSRYGSTESTIVQLTSYGYDLDQYPVTTAYDNNTTTVPFNSYDPSNIVSTAVDRFMQTANQEQVSYTMRTPTSIQLSGSVVSYTFRNNTYKEVLDKTIELLPSNWYYRIGLGDNTVYVRERSATPQHLFYLGKHIKALDLKGTILDVVNHTLFTGGGDPALYIERKEAPAPRTRRGLEIMSDSRVTLEESAGIISEGTIEQKNKLQYRTTVEILSKQYDIESIQVGETIGFRAFGNYVDSLVMQVVGLSYQPDSVQLALQSKPISVNRRIEDIRRQLIVNENQNIPSSPI